MALLKKAKGGLGADQDIGVKNAVFDLRDGVKLILERGSLEDCTADALVSSTSSMLMLRSEAKAGVAFSLIKKVPIICEPMLCLLKPL